MKDYINNRQRFLELRETPEGRTQLKMEAIKSHARMHQKNENIFYGGLAIAASLVTIWVIRIIIEVFI